jgi:hypothetical protein
MSDPKYATGNAGQQMRLTDDELELIRATFKGNDRLLKLLRKMFLPEYDPTAPFGQSIDLWLAATDLKALGHDEAYQLIMARNMVISHVEAQIISLQHLAESFVESPEEMQAKKKKDSAE